MKKLSELEVNENIFFKRVKEPFVIKAKGENFLIAVQESGEQYTIVDVVQEICGPHDRLFNFYNFKEQESIDMLLHDIIHRVRGLIISERHRAKVSDVINLRKTLSLSN
ncbi:hypothetical protein [Paenibacillus pinihumi]|uniref:hypothetical protein n=1 Tax=Paenibacillus pinihumi TaxID=669462 RepID=UPI00048ABA73|nr:hypothetical protein [Paenibacillus pinihumi]